MILLVAGTRPNFMKVAPVHRALARRGRDVRLLHTGQHFDASMSEVFFADLGLPTPDVMMQAGGGTHAEQTAAILVGVERALLDLRPRLVVVVGDVTSTLSASLAAAKLGIPVAHVESGLRSGDWTMPEEINRVLTDQLSDLLLVTSREAEAHLAREGIAPERIVFVGNVMIDSLHYASQRPTDALKRFGVGERGYALVTLHRPANVDTRETLAATLDALQPIAAAMPVLLPLHPRTSRRAEDLGLGARLRDTPNLSVIPPVGYNDFVTLMRSARLVATDSGGIQEETTALGVPCLTLRGGTERPVTVDVGTNEIVGLDVGRITAAVQAIVAGKQKKGRIPEGWDGDAATRVADAIDRFLAGSPPPKTAGPRA